MPLHRRAHRDLKDISIKGVELEPVLVGYLCQGYAVTGPLDLTGEASLRGGDPLRTAGGTGRLRVGRGRVVGAAALGLVRDVVAVARPGGARSRRASRARRSDPTARLRVHHRPPIASRTAVVATDDLRLSGRRAHRQQAGTYGLADGRIDAAVTLTQGRTQVKARVTGTAGESCG